MTETATWLPLTELDAITMPEMASRIAAAEEESLVEKVRVYPGYPRWKLPRPNPRWFSRLDQVLLSRRSNSELLKKFPSPSILGRFLFLSHGVNDDRSRGPTPSAGGLQSLELILVHWQNSWLPKGAYHYERSNNQLTQVVKEAREEEWNQLVPSLRTISGGVILWIIVGDTTRILAKYGKRGERFLLLEAGHLMQNLCLVSCSLGYRTVPLGGYLEQGIARKLKLSITDKVLYLGICG